MGLPQVVDPQVVLFLQGLKGSPMTLVFGCRDSDTDHLYKEETLDMRDNGTLSSVTTAYSRQTGQPKVDTNNCSYIYLEWYLLSITIIIYYNNIVFIIYCYNLSVEAFVFETDAVVCPFADVHNRKYEFLHLFLVQVYVQDILREQLNDKVFEVLHHYPGHLYICGGISMAHDVAATIQEILVSRLGITLTQAEEYLSRLKVNLQLHFIAASDNNVFQHLCS